MTDIYRNDYIIYMSYIVQTFQLGSSTVVTLPKGLGIGPGEKLKVEKIGKKIILKEKKLSDKEVEKLVKSLSGKLKLKYHFSPEELNKMLDEEYEKMLP